jgi:hypothetical protein
VTLLEATLAFLGTGAAPAWLRENPVDTVQVEAYSSGSMKNLPGWLIHRAQTAGASHAWVILAPVGARSSAIYLLQIGGTFELHVVEDASNGIDGVTIPMSKREAFEVLQHYVGAVSGKSEGVPFRERGAVDHAMESMAEGVVIPAVAHE